MALASRKILTTVAAPQPTCGGRTSSPQHGPAPAGGPGAEAACGLSPAGMTEHPLATMTAATSAVTTHGQPAGAAGTGSTRVRHRYSPARYPRARRRPWQ